MTTQPLKVDNTAFLIEKLASECAPLQYVRELTVNSLEAIIERRKRGWNGEGIVQWDVDWLLAADNPGIYKLQISDNGTGMTGQDMERYINSLSSSGRIQSFSGNYGLGAKITAGVENPKGLIYKSWVDGEGSIAILHKNDEQNVYGLQQLELPNGTYAHHSPIADEAKPAPIDQYGTAVVLMGKSESDITMKPTGLPLKWLIRYLNTRFFELPEGITIKVRDFSKSDPSDWPTSASVPMNEQGSQLRTVRGMKRHLEDRSDVLYGTVDLSTARAHWYLLPEEPIQQSDIWETAPHVAALFQSELYEMRAGRLAYGRIRDFGVLFGYDRIALYLEPRTDILPATANTARSQLVVNGEPLPWDDWAKEFRQNLPQEIKDMMDNIVASSEERDHREAIRRRLRDIRSLLSVSRYRRNPHGKQNVGGSMPGGAIRSGSLSSTGGSSRGGGAGGGAGGLYGAYLSAGGDAASAIASRVNDPDVMWVSVEKQTRVGDDELEDRAARFSETENKIFANSDFRIFSDMIEEVATRYPSAPSNEIKDVVEEWFEQQLIEAVLGIQTLKGSPAWDTTTIAAALSPEALTTAVMPRYNTMRQITRALGARLGAAASNPV